MADDTIDVAIEKAKQVSLKVADAIPLPLHFIFDAGLSFVFLVSWLWPFDPIPFVDEIFTLGGMYFYNAYILKRTYGAINPMRIVRGETPVAKRRLGLLPYEDKLEAIRDKLKAMRKDAKNAEIPGLTVPKVDKLLAQIKEVEKRLHALDHLLTRPEFQEGAVKTEIAKIQARLETTPEEEIQDEFKKAIGHAHSHLQNIDRLRDERNRLVARLDRFRLQIDDTFSKMMAASITEVTAVAGADRMFEELFSSVTIFDDALKELQQKPSSDLLKAAVAEVEETEKKFATKLPVREKDKTL